MDKIYVEVKVKLSIRADVNILHEIMGEMACEFTDTYHDSIIKDTQIIGWEIVDAK